LDTVVVGQLDRLRQSIGRVIRGKAEVVDLALITLLAGGHLLVEDVPGVGKTTLAQAIARSLDGSFHRIQFTSDLLPSDIVGVSVFHRQLGEFEFKPGPIFANVILADEINRTTPKTQSSLLEAMAEGRVTVEGRTYELPRPFLVLATQNPIEHYGTYPLPESQLDRFMMRIRMGYPALEEEKEILRRQARRHPLEAVEPVMRTADLLDLQGQVREVHVEEVLIDYLMSIVEATRLSERLELGVSPRGALTLYRAAQAAALSQGRNYCLVDDLKRLVLPVFGHRVVVGAQPSSSRRAPREAGTRRLPDAAEEILAAILKSIPVPL
jgi:MoxR-like ATPase